MSANFQFLENIEKFTGDKMEKEYFLKIFSKDNYSNNPFDFNVKFNMDNQVGQNNFRKEAVIYSKYKNIKKIEISDVIVPRYIPQNMIGQYFDGVNLVSTNVDISNHRCDFLLSCYSGVNLKDGDYYTKLTNYKETIILKHLHQNQLSIYSDIEMLKLLIILILII